MPSITHNIDLIHTEYTEHILEQNSHLFDGNNWNSISQYQKLSEPFIEKYQDKIDWEYICDYQPLSEPFIEKYHDKLDWYGISEYQCITFNFIKKYKQCIVWSLIFRNTKIPINSRLLLAPYFNWEYICHL